MAVLVDQLEGVAPVAVHVAIAIRDATVTEQKGDLGMRGGAGGRGEGRGRREGKGIGVKPLVTYNRT